MQKHSAGVQDAVRALQAEEERLAEELEALKHQAGALAADLKRVRVGLAALTGDGGASRPSGSGKGGLSDADALQVVLEALAAGPLAADALKAKLLAHAKASGLSGTGVHLVLRRVLKHDQFAETKDGYALKHPHAESA